MVDIKETVKSIIADIEDDIKNRCGIGNEWYEIDEEIKEEIREKWSSIILDNLGELPIA